MEISKLLELTPEQRAQRKADWEERQRIFGEGRDPDKEKADDRAMKALILLRQHVNGNIQLTEEQRFAYSGIVVNRSTNDFYFFCRHVLDMDLLTEQTHKRWCLDHQKSIKLGKKRVMRLKPRACFKTTIYGIGATLWVFGCFSPQIRILYTSANALLLQEVSDKINQYIGSEKNETLYSLIFGITKDGTAKNTSDVINIKGRSGKGFSLVFKTAGGSVVGSHPNLIIIDDCLDANDRESSTTREGKKAWFDSLVPLLVPFKDEKSGITFETIFFIGTRYHLKDLIAHIMERNDNLPADQKWDIESESICDDYFKSNYPDFISDEKITELRNSMSDVAFSCQYANQPLMEGMQIFDIKKLTFVREEQVDLRLGEMLCVFDPSLGKSSSDIPAVWWLNYHNGVITCYDAIDERVQLNLIVHQIAAKNQLYNCRHMIYESNNASLIGQSIQDAHNRIGWKINLESVHHSSSKLERIVSIQPNLYSGHVQFMDDYKVRYPEAMNQIVFFGAYGADDCPDALEIGISFFKEKRFKFIRYEACL